MDRIANHFSNTYTEARGKFLAAVQAGGARLLSSHTNPAKGPSGEDCITDVAWQGPADARKLLILVSGTHGAEGYAGSGCHVTWLQEGWFERVAPRDTAILFIHAINPHAKEVSNISRLCNLQVTLVLGLQIRNHLLQLSFIWSS